MKPGTKISDPLKIRMIHVLILVGRAKGNVDHLITEAFEIIDEARLALNRK